MQQAMILGRHRFYGLGAVAFSASVKALQQALKDLAATGVVAADPGTVDGLMGPKTRNAVLAIIPAIPKLGGDIKTALQVAAIAAAVAGSATLDRLITSYAAVLTPGIRLLILAGPTGATPPPPDLPPAPPAPPPPPPPLTVDSFFSPAPGTAWYKTWYGAGGALAGVGVLGWLLLGKK